MKKVSLLHKQDVKTRFIALNLAIDYIDIFKFLQENPRIIKDVIDSTLETNMIGKYVLNFFENLLRAAKSKCAEHEKCNFLIIIILEWFDIWIDEYLEGMKSPHEKLRNSVCTLITPIVIKINKSSLPYILSLV